MLLLMEDILQDKKRLFIIGAGSFGREMESWLELIPNKDRNWYIEGFLESEKYISNLNNYRSDYKIVGEWNNFKFKKDDLCIITIADCQMKNKIYTYLQNKVKFFTYIAPNSIIGKHNIIGEGSIICPNCIITTNVNIGKCVIVNIGSQIGHDVIISDFVSIMANVDIAGKCKIEKYVYIGSNATVIPDIIVKANSKIGAGSIVIRDVNENTTVFGNPALKIYKK